jgi:hypothetical protein
MSRTTRVTRSSKNKKPVEDIPPLYRWSGEKVNPASDLGWSFDKRDMYRFPRFNEPGIMMYAPNAGSEDLPSPLVEVLTTFISNIDREMWKKWEIDWNKDTPALQFHNKRPLLSEGLSLENVFHCNLAKDYYIGICESGTKKIADQALLDNPLEWWQERFGTFVESNQPLLNPKIKRVAPVAMQKGKVSVVYEDSRGITTKRVMTREQSEVIPEGLTGDRTVNITITPDEKVVDEKDPFTGERLISIGKCRRDAIEYLAQSYKIRLQIRPEYQVWLVNQLLEYFSTDDVGACVEVFKCSLVYSKIISEDANNRLASIVIYVSPGKSLAKRVLDGIISRFTSVEHLGLDIPSRYNLTVNKLVYYSGGDGDLKTKLVKIGLLDKYFDKTSNPPHAYFIGYEL